MPDEIKLKISIMKIELFDGTLEMSCGCKLTGGIWRPENIYSVLVVGCHKHAGFGFSDA